MIWDFILTVGLLAVTVLLSIAVFTIDEKVKRLEELRAKEVGELAEKVATLSINLEKVRREVEEPEDEIEAQIQQARKDVLSEYIQSITAYSPYAKRG